MPSDRYAAPELRRVATDLFAAAGTPPERAAVIAGYLVDADMMGHDTHGLAQVPGYLGAIRSGAMATDGEPETVADTGPCVTWDGGTLSGVWLVDRAMHTALARAAEHGLCAVTIRRSHHIACLAAYLPKATERGCLMVLASSDPSVGAVAPHGSFEPVYTPNPLAVGIPTDGDPILIDISMSTTTMGLAGRCRDEGRPLPAPWLIDNRGQATDDPAALDSDPPGAILPLGGVDVGHKGFGLGLMIEALTSGLGGWGRADGADGWGASVFVLILDPAAFGGADAFRRETGWLADACRRARVADGNPPVRLPGDGALARMRAADADGLQPYPGIIDTLGEWAATLGVAPPVAMD